MKLYIHEMIWICIQLNFIVLVDDHAEVDKDYDNIHVSQ